MHPEAYRKRTNEAASVLGGRVVSLAGGYYGVQVPVDGAYLIFALDLDGGDGWAVWTEDRDGERCCDHNAVEIGWPRPDQLLITGLNAIADHRCT